MTDGDDPLLHQRPSVFQGGNWQTLGSLPADFYQQQQQQNVNAVSYAGGSLSGGAWGQSPLLMTVNNSSSAAKYTSAASLLADHT